MTCEMMRDRLDEYLAQRLAPEDLTAVREHLAACAACRADLEAARALAPLAAALPRERAPSRPLWPEIERCLAPRPAPSRVRRLLPLAAAIGVVSLIGVIAVRRGKVSPVAPAGVTALLADYGGASADLERTLFAAATHLAPPLAAAARLDLRTLDDAIAESESALAADPSNVALQELVLSAHRKKLALLRQVAELAAES